MATVLCHVNIVSRGSGHSAVAGAAYRAGEKIRNDWDGVCHNYSRRTDVVHAEILKPDHAPEWAGNRSRLWNEVERIEKQCNSQLARQIEIALPRELTTEQNIELARDYAGGFVQQGMVADLTLHDDHHNPHAHIMLTMRSFNPDGTWGSKAKKEYVLDGEGNRIRLPGGEWKSRRVNTTDWDNRDNVEKWRERYAAITNYYLEKYGHEQRIDHRSFERQGLEQTPTVRLSRKSWEMEKRGIHTPYGDINREIQEQNRQRKVIHQELSELNRQKEEILAGQGKKKEEAKELSSEPRHGVDRYQQSQLPKLVRDPNRHRRYVNRSKEAVESRERKRQREQHPLEHKAEPRHGVDRYKQDSSFERNLGSPQKLETVIQRPARESGQQDSSFKRNLGSPQKLETVTHRRRGFYEEKPQFQRPLESGQQEADQKREIDRRQEPAETSHSLPPQRRAIDRYHERIKRQSSPKRDKDHERDP